jgi:cellulose synthase/poly-beta-1,6-N-acetylglucosamine synthase-like glycosyltransferase
MTGNFRWLMRPRSRSRSAHSDQRKRAGPPTRVPTAAVRAVVASWNGEDLLPSCLDSLLAQTVAANLQVVVVDHASEDGTAAMLAKRYRAVTSLPAGPHLRFAGGADLGWLASRVSSSRCPAMTRRSLWTRSKG